MLAAVVRDEVTLVFEPRDDEVVVRADPGRLGQALVNLVVNATEAIRGGGQIVVRVGASADRAVIEVEDSGTGIQESDLGQVLEPFFTTKPEGTGLGLAIVNEIVAQAGGQIDVRSTPGEGATFTITLPRLDQDADELEKPDAVEEQGVEVAGGESILVVEDNEIVRDLLRSLLEHAGYAVAVARDGKEALAVIAASGEPAAVISDVQMPNMGGLELADQLEQRYPAVKVLLVSGYTAGESAADLQKRAFLQKPFGPDELESQLRLLLDR